MYNRLKKVLPILLFALVVVFSVLYFFLGRRYGVAYGDALYFPATEGDTTVYSAKADGQPASFTVHGDTVTYRWGDTVYGPYTVREDPTAVPGGEWASFQLTGVEVRKEDQLLFRGGCDWALNLLIKEDGQPYSAFQDVTYSVNGVTYDTDGNPVDPHEPSLRTLIRFSQLPQPDAHRGNTLMWSLGLFLAVVAFLLIRFDDAIFRLNLFFRIRHPEDAEPSDWELAGRVLGWLAFTALSFGVFLAGLIMIS